MLVTIVCERNAFSIMIHTKLKVDGTCLYKLCFTTANMSALLEGAGMTYKVPQARQDDPWKAIGKKI